MCDNMQSRDRLRNLEILRIHYAISRLRKFPDCAEHTLHTRSVFTWIEYLHFVQYGFVLETYKLNSWLGLSEKIVALFHSSTVCYFYPLILLSDDGKLVRVYLLYAGMLFVLNNS